MNTQQFKKKIVKKTIFTFTLFLLMIWYKSPAQNTQQAAPIKQIVFYDDTLQMKKELLSFIPIGTSLKNASSLLRENKIKFEFKNNSDFLFGFRLLKNLDYIFINYKGTTLEQAGKTWQIALLHKNSQIVEAKVSFKTMGQ